LPLQTRPISLFIKEIKMITEQIYTGCLAQGAYYIRSKGEVAIIDPLREVEPYIARAEADNAKIKYVFETHFHADFVSGHLDLAAKTGAQIVYGPTAQPSFDAKVATDGEIFSVGNCKIKVLHTPGHTMESSCFLLIDEEGKERILFSGDTVFIGDVGRPDLAQKATNLTQEELAGLLYESIHTKILPLSDDIIVYPGHGAGSACGKNMSKETYDTLGHQKKVNYALQADMTKEKFIEQVTTGLMPPPGYFPFNVGMNKKGYEKFDVVLSRGMTALNVEQVEEYIKTTDVLVLDTRHQRDFVKSHIPNSIFIGIDGDFAPWVGALVPRIDQKIIIITEEGREEEVITRLSRVGYDNCIGYLKGGVKAWEKAGKYVKSIESINVETFRRLNSVMSINVLDVRRKSEYESQHLIDAVNVPLDNINRNTVALDTYKTYYIHCAGGYRSVIFISILNARGFENLINVEGGFNEIKKEPSLHLTDYVCPTTML
jgi:glyoxylase-like metal-dependent hydrolase (beta-lactamase superfamily II)/rhodanese-related sulfurtransferase